jgi:hypothetical protein
MERDNILVHQYIIVFDGYTLNPALFELMSILEFSN